MKTQNNIHKQDKFGEIAKKVAGASGTPATFLIAVGIIVIWAVTGPIFNFNDTWQLVINTGTTIITFLMVFLIQNTQNRDATAVQLKLDEIIIAIAGADNKAVELEDASEEELAEAKTKYIEMAEEASDDLNKAEKGLNDCENKLEKTEKKIERTEEKVEASKKRHNQRKAS